MRSTARVGVVLGGLFVALSVTDSPSAQQPAEPVSAQQPAETVKLEGEIVTGVRLFIEEPSKTRSAKFEEYRDMRDGLLLQELRLRVFTPDEKYSFGLEGSKWGFRDQEYLLHASRLGLWSAEFEWDQTPHVYSTTARLLATEVRRGVFVLPTPRPPLAAYNLGRELDEIATRWDTARFAFVFTPTPDLDLIGSYTRIHKDGNRPMGISFGLPARNFVEVLAPIDQTIHDLRIGGTLVRDSWQLTFGYAFSMFENEFKSVTADNPCFGLAACGADAAGAPRSGRQSLDPSNTAHTFSLGGGIDLPMHTRLNMNLSYSLRLQNEQFLPHTNNPAFAGDPRLILPDNSLDGIAGTTNVYLSATTRPVERLTLSAKFRFYDYHDWTDPLVFPAHVINDRNIVVGSGSADNRPTVRVARRYGYDRENLDLDAKWRFSSAVSTTVGVGWEAWHRADTRNVTNSDEVFGKAVLDYAPLDWLNTKLTYRPSIRRIGLYNPNPRDGGTSDPQPQELRKFDQADRDRHQLDLLTQFMPFDSFTTTLTSGYVSEDYVSTYLGREHANAWSAGIDFSWTPSPRISVSTGYVHEVEYRKQRNRSWPPLTPGFGDFDWISNTTDTYDSIYLKTNVAVIPRVLDWKLGATYSYALGETDTRNPVAPTSGTAGDRVLARARSWPAFEDRLIRLETGVLYHFWKTWTAGFGYAYESFEKHDWRTDQLRPFLGSPVNGIWLGSDLKGYDAHIIQLTLGYRFR